MALIRKKVGGLILSRKELKKIIRKLEKENTPKGITIGFKEGLGKSVKRYCNLENIEIRLVYGDDFSSKPLPDVKCNVVNIMSKEVISNERGKKHKWEYSKFLKKVNFRYTFYGLTSLKAILEYGSGNDKIVKFSITGVRINYGKHKVKGLYENGTKCFSFEISPFFKKNDKENNFIDEVPGSLVGVPCPPLWDPDGKGIVKDI